MCRRILHPYFSGPTADMLADLYQQHSRASPSEQSGLMARIKEEEARLDLTEYNSVFSAVDRAVEEVRGLSLQLAWAVPLAAACSLHRDCSTGSGTGLKLEGVANEKKKGVRGGGGGVSWGRAHWGHTSLNVIGTHTTHTQWDHWDGCHRPPQNWESGVLHVGPLAKGVGSWSHTDASAK